MSTAIRYYCLLVVFSSATSSAQTIPDSLLNKLHNARHDSVRARTLLDIGESIEEAAPEKSLEYYKQALELSTKIKHINLVSSSMVDIGIAYIETNDMDKALATFVDAIPIVKQLNNNSKTAGVLSKIGNVYQHKKEPVKALDYYMQSIKLLEGSSDSIRLSNIYANLMVVFDEQKQFDKAIEYGNKAISLAQDDYTTIHALINLSYTYGHLKQSEKEYEMLDRALPLAIRYKNQEILSTVYTNLGDYYYKKEQYQVALKNYREAYTHSERIGNRYHLCTASSILAVVYNQLGQYDKAMHSIMEAEKLAAEVGSRANLKEIYLTRSEIEQHLGNYNQAYNYMSKSAALGDSLFKVESSKQVAEVEAKYENEKRLKEIAQLQEDKIYQQVSLNQKSTFNYVLIASVLTLLTIGFFAYTNFKRKQQLSQQTTQLHAQRIKELELEKQLVAYNSLLKGQELERSRMAKDLHDGLGGMLSGVKLSLGAMKGNIILSEDNTRLFAKVLDQLDHSISEMRRVAHNMMPEALVKLGIEQAIQDYCNGLNESIQLHFKVQFHGLETRMEAATEIVVYRIVQELLNNVVKHADATLVLVQIMRHDNNLNITIEDNGKGFDVSDSNIKGDGLNNVRSRS